MKKITFLLFILLMSGNVFGAFEYADTVIISSFPYTASTNNRLYVIATNHTGVSLQTTGAIYFNDCDTCGLASENAEKNTISYVRNGTARLGIYARNCDSLVIRRIRLTPEWAYADTAANGVAMLSILDCRNAWVDTSYFENTGYSSQNSDWYGAYQCVAASDNSRGSYNINVINDSIIMNGYGYKRRDIFPQVGIYFASRFGDSLITTGSRSDYSYRSAHNYIESNWVGVMVNGTAAPSGVVVVDTNDILLEYVNTSDSSFLGSFHGDGGGFSVYRAKKVFITGNTVNSNVDTTATPKIYGGSGCYIAVVDRGGSFSATPRSEVSYNTINTSLYRYGIEAGKDSSTADHGTAMFVKYGCQEIDFNNNNLTSTVNLSSNPNFPQVAWLSHMTDCNWSNNTYTGITDNDGIRIYGIRYRGMDSTMPNTFTDETINSNDYFFFFDPDDGDGGYGLDGLQNNTYESFTLNRIDTVSTMSGNGSYFFYNTQTFDDNLFLNTTITGTASDTGWENSNSFPTTGEIEWQRDLQINVKNSVGQGINGTVVLTNAYGQEIYNSAVGTDGLDTSRVQYWRLAGAGDSVAYNAIIGTASYAAETNVVDTFNVSATDSTITFTFTGVEATNTKKLQGVYIRKDKL